MMKKIVNIFLVIVLCISMSFIFQKEVNATIDIKAGDTLADLKNEVKKLQAKAAEQKNKKKQTQSEINANIAAMQKANNELEDTKIKIGELNDEIERTNRDIEKVKEESKELLILYQQLESENIYMAYITGASSMTELIMRMDVINQLTDYNEQKLHELEVLISNNKKLNKELEKYQVTLDKKIIAYETSIEVLEGQVEDLEEGVVDINKQIESAQEQVKSFESIGCKDNQELLACLRVGDNAGWLKPVPSGRITSLYGYRTSPTAGASSNHKGIDIGVAEGTKVYGTANGTVGAIVRRSSCGGNMVYIWAYVNGKKYTYVFMHLKEIWVNVGDTVKVDTVVGLSGGGSTARKNGGYDSCTTGAHLHYGLAQGGFYNSSNFNSHTINPPGYPGLYQWFYSRY